MIRPDSDPQRPSALQAESVPAQVPGIAEPGCGDSQRREMAMVDMHSTDALPDMPDGAVFPPSVSAVAATERDSGADGDRGMFWFDGDVLMCACPQCQAPMTVRLWLMIADCWRCEASIELTVEQEWEARRLLNRRKAALEPVAAAAAPSSVTGAPRLPAEPSPPGPSDAGREPVPPPREPTADPMAAVAHMAKRRGLVDWLRAFLKNMPAWLVSLVFHMILLTILGLLTSEQDERRFITLSARVSRLVREGGDTRIIEPTANSVFDMGLPDALDLDDPIEKRIAVQAEQDALKLQVIDPNNPHLPELERVKRQIGGNISPHAALAARDPRVRIEMVKREGGTTLTEAAVARGLRWLANHQNSDGSWSLDRFHRAASCGCGSRGSLRSDVAGTSLALLPFLGAGQTHLTGIYKDEVAQGLRWLVQVQKSNGDLRGGSGQYPGMYAQGQAAIVLCEAFLMTGDEELRVPAQNAIDFITDAQYTDGGWRYYPASVSRDLRGDTSVLGWQLMALQSARSADLSVTETTLENASHFLDSVEHDGGAAYSYLPREDPSPPMTAEALLCRIYLGWSRGHPALREGVLAMVEEDPPSEHRPNIYYWYYATQTLHHFGGTPWQQWNLQMREVLVSTQEKRGHAAGSWTPDGPLSSQGGRIYMTSLAICCLEVYYRHLPIFRQISLE